MTYAHSTGKMGPALRNMREAHELTQAQFADLMGTTQQRVSAVENGRENPTPHWMRRAHEVFAASLERKPQSAARAS